MGEVVRSGQRRPGRRAKLFVLAVAVTLGVVLAPSALAATFVVQTNADSGAGSLRQAITDANGGPGADVIQFDLPFGGSTITPATDLPELAGPTTIDGSAAGAVNGVQD